MKASQKNHTGEVPSPAVPLEIQTHLPLRTPDTGRTEYVAPVSRERVSEREKGERERQNM